MKHPIRSDNDASQNEGILSQESVSGLRTSYKDHLNSELAQADSYQPQASMLQKQWSGIVWPASDEALRHPDTGVDSDTLKTVGKASVSYGDGIVSILKSDHGNFNHLSKQEIHPRLSRHVSNRLKSLDSGKNIDWATAEARIFVLDWLQSLMFSDRHLHLDPYYWKDMMFAYLVKTLDEGHLVKGECSLSRVQDRYSL